MLRRLEAAAKACGIEVRWGRGHFHGGRCVVKGESVIILNRQHPSEVNLAALVTALEDTSLDEVPMSRAARTRIEQLMEQYASR